MSANTNRAMTAEQYKDHIKFMVDKMTDIKDLRQLYLITHVKFVNRADAKTCKPGNQE